MRISRRGEYGLAAILYLAAQPDGKLSLRDEIAGRCGIPRTFLAQILAKLRHKGILGSVRGARGGYYLKEKPDRLSLADVLEALEGPITLIRTIKDETNPEADFVNSTINTFFTRLQARGYELLKSMKIAELLPVKEVK